MKEGSRSIRNALDRARLRQASRLFEQDTGPVDAEALSRVEAGDIAASRVFSGGLEPNIEGKNRLDEEIAG